MVTDIKYIGACNDIYKINGLSDGHMIYDSIEVLYCIIPTMMIQISKLIKPEIRVTSRLVIDGNLVVTFLCGRCLATKATSQMPRFD